MLYVGGNAQPWGVEFCDETQHFNFSHADLCLYAIIAALLQLRYKQWKLILNTLPDALMD